MNSLPSCSKRWAMFTVSPTTVKFTRPGAPILPTTTGPECRPMRTRIGGWPAARRTALSSRDHAGDGERRAHRMVGMVLHARQAAPHRHHGVADVLVDHALLVVDAGAEQREVMVEQVGGLLLGQVLGLRREFDDVGEHHRDVAPARAHGVLAELHQPEDQAVRHVGAEPFQRAARLVEAVAGIVDLAQPRAAMERLVELQPLDRLGRRGDGADRARHAEARSAAPAAPRPRAWRRRRWRRWSAGRDRRWRPRAGSTARPARARGRSRAARDRRTPSAGPSASTTWPSVPSARSIRGVAHRRIPDPGQHRIVDLLDGRQLAGPRRGRGRADRPAGDAPAPCRARPG